MREPTRKEREKERIRQEILEAAEEEFARSGFRDTNMSAIAARVELSVGTLYNFFQSKNALFITLMDAKADEFFRWEVEAVHGIKCPVEKIRFILKNMCKALLENLNLFRLFIGIKTEKNLPTIEKEHPLITVRVENHLRFIAGLFQEAIGAGLIRPAPPMLLAVCMDNLIFGFVEHLDRLKGLGQAENLVDELEELFLNGILTGERPAAR